MGQNARKIADFPFPFPYAQASMVMLLLHWALTPITCSMMFKTMQLKPFLAGSLSFLIIFFVWCINFIALQLESPFGDKDNDLPMEQMQRDWNKSLTVLLLKRGHRPPTFAFDPDFHRELQLIWSDGSTRELTSEVLSRRLTKVQQRRTKKSVFRASQRMSGSIDSLEELRRESLRTDGSGEEHREQRVVPEASAVSYISA